MNLYEIKDYVREHFGRVGIPTAFLNLALEMGRKEIENEANFWWMEDWKDFNLTASTASYPLKTGAIEEPNFKDAVMLLWKTSTDKQWEPVTIGPKSKEELDREYQTDATGEPEQAVIFNETLHIYPIPDALATYNMRLYFYQYTSLPAQTATDDLITGFPMGLIYSALAQGYETELKDLQGASYWRALLAKNIIPKIKREHLKRSWMDKIVFIPHSGPFDSYHRLDHHQIYRR